MEYVKFCKIDELENKEYITRSIFGKKIAVIKDNDSGYYASEVACKHQGADLTKGKKEGDVFTCPRHGWKYNIRSGECINQNSPKLRKFITKIENDFIKISLEPLD